ncbi:hypothetical protein I2750_19640 [Bacillus sp. PR5]|nr:hypothetical protein [Bacillus sp. PR5]
MTAKAPTIDFHEFERACDASVKEEVSNAEQQSRPFGWRTDEIAKMFPPKPTRVGVDWGQDDTAVDTPKQLLAKEIATAQAAADAIYAKRAILIGEASRRALEIKAQQERLAKMLEAQKGTMARIRTCDQAAKAHRQTVFTLQETGR